MNHSNAGLVRSISFLWIVVLGLVLSGCIGQENQPGYDDGVELPFENLLKDIYANYNDDFMFMVLTNEGDVQDVLPLIRIYSDMPPVELDFTNEIGVIIFLGQKPNVNYDIKIEKIFYQEDKNTISIITNIDLTGDEPDIPAGEEVTSPYHLVKIPKSDFQMQYVTFNIVVDQEIVMASGYYIP